jgi:hypothetical protein
VLSHSLRRGDAGGVRALHERRPQRGAGERRLSISKELIDHVPVLTLGANLAHQPLQSMAQVPLAQVQLGVGETAANRVHQGAVVVAHHPGRRPGKGCEERLPVDL